MQNNRRHSARFLRRVMAIMGAMGLCASFSMVSCSSSGNSSFYGYSGPRNTCVDSGDCDEGVCHGTRKVCVVSLQSEKNLWARVIFDSPRLKPQVFRVPMVSTDTLSLDIREPVLLQDLTAATSVSADILFFELSNTLPGQDADVSVYKTYLQTDAGTAGAESSAFYVLPGLYDITVYPVADAKNTLPVSTFREIEIDSQGVAWQKGVRLKTVLPEAGYKLEGKAYYSSTVESNVAARDITVRAFDAETDQAISHPFALSCRSRDDCGYSIPLPTGIQSVKLHFFKPDEPFFPSYIQLIDSLTFGEQGIAKADIVLPPLRKPVQVTGNVYVNPVPDGIAPPPACRVLFEMVDDDSQSLTYWVNTNSYGEVERDAGLTGVYLYPGRYRVTVFPVVDNSTLSQKYAQTTLVDILEVSDDASDLSSDGAGDPVNQFSIELEPRLKITGTVTFKNSVIPDTFLTAYNVEQVQPYSKVLTTLADETAGFDIWLDNNIYYVVASPPAISGFVGGGVWNIRKSKNYVVDAEMQIPFAVEGTLNINTESTWFAGIQPGTVYVEWYQDFAKTAYRSTRTRVQENYFFSALLPPQ